MNLNLSERIIKANVTIQSGMQISKKMIKNQFSLIA